MIDEYLYSNGDIEYQRMIYFGQTDGFRELWQELIALTEKHKVTFIKVKGHSDNEFNNRCDFLATNEISKNN